MKTFLAMTVAFATISLPAADAAYARSPRAATAYDGPWHLSFVTRSGGCAPSYDFDVNISQGIISHPNLVRFRGTVSRGGNARASVTVQDKSASGSGRMSSTSGQGSWRGYSGGERCAGYWTARKT